MDGSNANQTDYVGNRGTWYTFKGTVSSAVTVPNNGNSSVTISIGPWGSYNDFNVWCMASSNGNITISAGQGQSSIPLTKYETDEASPVSVTSPVNLGGTATITINKFKSDYTHTIDWNISGSSWTTIASRTTSSSVTLDTSTAAAYFETSTSITCTVRCITYKSSGSQVGVTTAQITVNATGSPSVTSISVSPVNDNDTVSGWGDIYAQGYSKVQATIAYTLPMGATLSGYKILINNSPVDTVSTGSDGSLILTTAQPVAETGSVRVDAVITDSRGSSGSAFKVVTVYPYTRPYASFAEAVRCGSDPNTEDKENGQNISAKISASYSSVNGHNSMSIYARYKPAGGIYPPSTVSLSSGASDRVMINGASPILTEQSYVVQFLICDSLHPLNSDPTTIEITIPTASVVMHARDGGKGIAFGGYNTKDAIEMWQDVYLYKRLILSPGMYGQDEPSADGAVEGQLYFQLID